jgi:Flp pilus assembly protein TadG
MGLCFMSDLTLGSIKLKRVDGQPTTAMERKTTIRRKGVRGSILRDTRGQSLVELAVMMPIFALLMCYAVDFGYFFLAAANISSSARIATQYSILGYQGPAQSGLANAGPVTDTTSVASLASAELASLTNSGTMTTIGVCTKALGMSTANTNLPKCSNYGVTGTSYTPTADPEAPRFVLQRVDITYTVQPPIPIAFFGTSLLPSMSFHRQVSMRAMD